jgi:beta-lactamase class A
MQIRVYVSLLSLFLVLLAACTTELPQSQPASGDTLANTSNEAPIDSTLFDSLRTIESRCDCRLGVAALHIESGWRTSWQGDETFPMASVAKLPMAITFLRALDAGRFQLDSAVELTRADHQPGGSRLFHRITRSGGTVSIRDLLDAMITESDNTASDKILRLVGGPAVADSLLTALGFPEIDITSYEGELILKWAGIDPATSDSAWTRDRIYTHIQDAGKAAWDSAAERLKDDHKDAASPYALVSLLKELQNGAILSPISTDTLLAIMGRTVTGKARIPGRLPEGTPVAHKTGTIGSVANDVGIITLPEGKGHLALAVLIKGAATPQRKRDAAIADVSALIYRKVILQ